MTRDTPSGVGGSIYEQPRTAVPRGGDQGSTGSCWPGSQRPGREDGTSAGAWPEARDANDTCVWRLIKVKMREMCKELAETLTYRCTCSSRSQPGHLWEVTLDGVWWWWGAAMGPIKRLGLPMEGQGTKPRGPRPAAVSTSSRRLGDRKNTAHFAIQDELGFLVDNVDTNTSLSFSQSKRPRQSHTPDSHGSSGAGSSDTANITRKHQKALLGRNSVASTY